MVHLIHRYGAAHVAPVAPALSSGLERVLDLIENHLDEDLSHATLAAAAGQSVYGFARSFAKTMGEPPHRYVLRRRVERARQLLTHTATPLADLAATLGFSSQAHLTTAFLRATGTTPARFRNALRG
jgi:AraC family transcriptional regulator